MANILSSPVHMLEASIIFYICIFKKFIFIHYQAHLNHSEIISLNTSGSTLDFWHILITLFWHYFLWMSPSVSLYFNFMFKNISFGWRKFQMVLSAEISICQTMSQKQWVKQLFNLLVPRGIHVLARVAWGYESREGGQGEYIWVEFIIFFLDPVFTQD